MEIALISDQHFGSNNFNSAQHKSYEKFYNEIFFPTLKSRKIKYLFDLGDTFDGRAHISDELIHWSKSVYFNKLYELGIKVYVLRGNHNPRSKNLEKKMDAISIIKNKFSNITLINSVSIIKLDNKKFVFLPFLDHRTSKNESRKQEYLSQAKAVEPDMIFTHLAFCGYHYCEKKKSTGGFRDHQVINYLDAPVISGHYHTRSFSDDFPFQYLGSPYGTRWAEFEVDRGFHLFDTGTLKTQFVKNKYQAFRCFLVNSPSDVDMILNVIKSKPSALYIIPSLDDLDLVQRIYKKLLDSDVPSFEFYDSNEKLNVLLKRLITMKEFAQAYNILNHAVVKNETDIHVLLIYAHILFGLGKHAEGGKFLNYAIHKSRDIDDKAEFSFFNEQLHELSNIYCMNENS